MLSFPFRLLLAAIGLSFLSTLQAKSSTGDSVLVLFDNKLQKSDFSVFFEGLTENGYEVTVRDPKDSTPVIQTYDKPNYDHVVVFAPETKNFAEDITPQALVSLLNSGTNVLFALSSKQNLVSSLASEFSLILPPPSTPLLSHFPKREESATLIPVPVTKSSPVISPDTEPVWFSGIPQALALNPLLIPILNAPKESFAADSNADNGAEAVVEAAEKGGEGLWAGSSLSLVTGFQTREGSARATWVGGVDMFSDALINKDLPSGGKSGNRRFIRDVVAWTFQESLVLRIDSTTHHLVNEVEPRAHYTINDEVTYTAHISAYDSKTASWEPYSGITDLQLEFTMLDPHIRTALLPVKGQPGVYEVTFRVPDRHGVFKFVLDYKRKGWSHLESVTVVPVVPPRHDGYPRFLSAAWPYYAGAISTSFGFLMFSAIWLAGEDSKQGGKKTKTE